MDPTAPTVQELGRSSGFSPDFNFFGVMGDRDKHVKTFLIKRQKSGISVMQQSQQQQKQQKKVPETKYHMDQVPPSFQT